MPEKQITSNYSDILSEIYSEMPVLKKHDFVVKRVDKDSEAGGSIEFMGKGEPENPTRKLERRSGLHGHRQWRLGKSKPYIEIYKNAPTDREELKKLIWGDMLHQLADDDPYWLQLRNEYAAARDNRQKEFDRKKYRDLVSTGQETRSFEKWMDASWADASVREPLKGNKEWLGFQTEAQKEILGRMKDYLGKQDDISFEEAVEKGLNRGQSEK
jgi:hypothetical protein